MQGIRTFIPTARKITYIRSLLRVGFDTIDVGSFVSPKAIPQMQDTAQVLAALDLSESNSKLLAIIANTQGDRIRQNEIWNPTLVAAHQIRRQHPPRVPTREIHRPGIRRRHDRVAIHRVAERRREALLEPRPRSMLLVRIPRPQRPTTCPGRTRRDQPHRDRANLLERYSDCGCGRSCVRSPATDCGGGTASISTERAEPQSV